MNLEYFPHFIRACFPNAAHLSNKALITFGGRFEQYLKEKLKDKPQLLAEMCDIEPRTVIPRMVSPLWFNGYHPALVIHLHQWAKELMEVQKE